MGLSLAPDDLRHALLLVRALTALAVVLTTAQLLGRRSLFSRRGLLSWEVLRACRPATSRGPLAFLLDRLFAERAFPALLAVRIAAALALPVAPDPSPALAVAVTLLAATTALLAARLPYGLDGSDQMQKILVGGLLCWVLGGRTPLAEEACLWFIAGQACLAYLGAGLAKAVSPAWRGGDALLRIAGTRLWGDPGLAKWLGPRPGLRRWLAWGVILPECFFPLALLGGRGGCVLFLAWGVLFHASLARLMGLNGFLWSFLATYPAIMHVAARLEDWWRG